MAGSLSNVVGFDDAPFAPEHRGDVLLVGAVCSRTRLDGVLSGHVQRDGCDATRRMIELVSGSQFAQHVRAVMLVGIAVAGFNVVDIHGLNRALGVGVLVLARRLPDMAAVRRALVRTGAGWERKWELIERAGAMEPMSGLWAQRAGIGLEEAQHLIAATTRHGKLPEPVRIAHLIAGGIARGSSRGRA